MKVWDEFLLKLEQELGVETVKKWLRTLKVIKFDACNLYLEAKDSFQALWFEEHIRKKAINSFVNNNNRKVRIHLQILGKSQTVQESSKGKKQDKIDTPPPFQMSFDQTDPLCTFNNFVENEHSKIPLKILKESSKSFNPIYLYGDSGCGKTHLLMAIADQERKAGKEVIYTRADTFTDHVVSAIRSGEMVLFREKYRHADVLLIDNVHLFSRKNATQEELFHTFNTLHLAGKQIILTAKCPPKDLQEIEPRLVSRFEWGIVLQLETFQGKDLDPVLKNKAEALSFPLPPKVLDFLVNSFKSSSKACVRALEALILRSHIQQGNQVSFRSMSPQLAEQYLADLLLAEKQQILTPEKVIHCCSLHYGIRPEDILGKAKSRNFTEPRQVAMYICRNHLGIPFTKIGELFGRDHSTVISSVKLIQSLSERKDPNLLADLQGIEKHFPK